MLLIIPDFVLFLVTAFLTPLAHWYSEHVQANLLKRTPDHLPVKLRQPLIWLTLKTTAQTLADSLQLGQVICGLSDLCPRPGPHSTLDQFELCVCFQQHRNPSITSYARLMPSFPTSAARLRLVIPAHYMRTRPKSPWSITPASAC